MAITSTGGGNPTIQVVSPAKNGTLPSQAAAAANQIILDTSLTAVNNGNITSPMVGRLICVRRGLATEETKKVISGADTATTLTMHEAWTVAPVNGDSYDVSYVLGDCAVFTGCALSAKTGIYEFSRRLVIGNASTFTFFSQQDQQAMEIRDDAANYSLIVDTLGRFDVGYKTNNTPGDGGVMHTLNDGLGEVCAQFNSGSFLNLNDAINFSFRNSTRFSASIHAKINVNSWKVVKLGYDALIAGSGSYRNVIWSEGTGSAQSIAINGTNTIDTWTLAGTYGFRSLNPTSTETVTLRNVSFNATGRMITVSPNKTWNVVNPIWTVRTGSQADIFFTNNTSNSVQEQFSFDAVVAKADGTPVSQSAVYVYEGLTNKNLPQQLFSNTSGSVTADVLVRRFVSTSTGLGVTQSGDFAIKAYKYGFRPNVGAITFDEAIEQTITMLVDPNVAAATSGAAFGGAPGIFIEKHGPGQVDTGSLKVFHYTGGAGTIPSETQVVSGTTTSARGHVVEATYGDATEGILVLSGWNGVEFSNGETVGNAAGWSATADLTGGGSSFYKAYTWELNCNGNTLQETYDASNAELGRNPTVASSSWKNVIIWGEDEQSLPMYTDGTNFYTERNINLTEGVWVSERGGGTISYMTSNDGTKFIPPVQYSFTLTGLKSDSEVRIYNATTDAELAGTENSTTSFTYNYTYSGDIAIYVVIFHLSWKDIRLVGLTLSNANQSIPIQQQTDRVYST